MVWRVPSREIGVQNQPPARMSSGLGTSRPPQYEDSGKSKQLFNYYSTVLQLKPDHRNAILYRIR